MLGLGLGLYRFIKKSTSVIVDWFWGDDDNDDEWGDDGDGNWGDE